MRSDFERKLAIQFRNEGKTYSQISEVMDISLDSVKSLCVYKQKTIKNKTGPKKKITRKNYLAIKIAISMKCKKSERITSPFLIQ